MAKMTRRDAIKRVAAAAVVVGTSGTASAAVCVQCKGSGTGPFQCTFCSGTGKDKDGVKCFFCNGKGFGKCALCNGTGQR